MRVAICVATFQRPVLLRSLLSSLAALVFPRTGAVDLLLVVVDNDRAETARHVVEEARGSVPFPVLYEVQPTRGIPLARNQGVALALHRGAEFVAFIDDDEVAGPRWLDELLAVQRRFAADVVSGPVLPRYSPGVPQWVVDGGFFELPRCATGDPIVIAATGNVLVARHCLAGTSSPFDPAFGIAGSEDSHFFMRLHRAGRTMVWADDAVVEELVPHSRATTGWILRRAFRIGNGSVFCERSLIPSYRWLVPRLAKATFRITEGLLLVGPSVLGGRAATVRALRKVAHGMGCLVALTGFRYREYEVIHGK